MPHGNTTAPASGPRTAAPTVSKETTAPAAAAGVSSQPKKSKKEGPQPVPAHHWGGRDPPSIVCEIMRGSKGPSVGLQGEHPMGPIGCLIVQVQQECGGTAALMSYAGILI